MPVTPSHAVVALAFVRTPLAPAAVAVGAMTPDLPLFVRAVPTGYTFTHTWAWLPVTAALAVVLLLVWRVVVRPVFDDLVPAQVARRLPAKWRTASGGRETFARRGAARASITGAVLTVLAAAIGVATHILWDTFTHDGRWGTQALPFLDERWGPLPGYKWLQYASGVFGVVVLALAAARWFRATPPGAMPERVLPTWGRVLWWLSAPALLAGVGVIWWTTLRAGGYTLSELAYEWLLPACVVWATTATVGCLVLRGIRGNPRDTPGVRHGFATPSDAA